MTDVPDVVVVGAATRDIVEEDPRGWMLGGGVTFGALTLARLGIHTGIVLGLDEQAAGARELDYLREAGAEIAPVPLEQGPVFTNIETLSGRIQIFGNHSDPIPVSHLPGDWRKARAWVFAPIASEIPDDWADVPSPGACVAFAWQGILRILEPGERVRPSLPAPSPLLRRADIVAVSRFDLPSDYTFDAIGRLLAPQSDLLLTAGLLGGVLLHYEHGGVTSARLYPSVASHGEVDPTGAGDTMLAGVMAARILAGDAGTIGGRDLRLGATVSSLLVEGPGMDSVPTLDALRARLTRDR